MNFGSIHKIGDAVNRICSCCELHFDIRPLPNVRVRGSDQMLQQKLKPIFEQWGDLISIRSLHMNSLQGYECEHSAQIVQVVEKLLGQKCDAVNYYTEAPLLTALSYSRFGSGSIEQAHQPDEFLATEFIKPTQELLTKLIYHFCAADWK